MLELTRNSRTGGNNLEAISAALSARGVIHYLDHNARREGHGVVDVLTVQDGQENALTPGEWRLLSKGYAPATTPTSEVL